jgi:hypothetical protein
MRRPATLRGRALVGLGIVGALVVVAGAIAGAGPAVGDQQAAATWSYTCVFPSGSQSVSVTVRATFPDVAIPNQAIQPTGVAVTVTLPAATARVSVTVAQRGATVQTSWSNLVAPAVAPPAAGDVTFSVGALNLQLTKADGTTETVDCTLDSGQNPVLATVPMPTGAVPRAAAPVDPNCPTPSVPALVETADIVGRTNLNKLGESVAIGSGTIVLTSVGTGKTPQGDFLLCWTAKITLAPSRSTVLTFGFQPTFATMTTTQVGTMIVETWQHAGVPMATVTGQENIALSDVTVNCVPDPNGTCVGHGAPLDVGPHCRTSMPVAINLSGIPPYQPLIGGPLQGVLTIPPFTGCGVTENLDPLLTAPLSGAGDLIRIIQGTPCSSFIPSCVPKPPTFK